MPVPWNIDHSRLLVSLHNVTTKLGPHTTPKNGELCTNDQWPKEWTWETLKLENKVRIARSHPSISPCLWSHALNLHLNPCSSKISNFYGLVSGNEQVVGLEISVDYVQAMQVLHAPSNVQGLFYCNLEWNSSWLSSTEKWPHWSTLGILSYNAPDKGFPASPNKSHNILMLHCCKHCHFFGKCWLHHHRFLHVILWSLQDLYSHFLSIVGSPVEPSKCTLCKSLAHTQLLQIDSPVVVAF